MNTTDELDRDVRIIRRNLAKGFVSRSAVDELLEELPDTTERAEWFDPEADDEDDED
ncbi:MAG: hypothetical protein H6744_08975 [Deltaproteobacteria bacterium]|nr:hypothetical protein [Deltaproteobacteria bacterium]MCB9786812.1 hypothetical protein [Deltaproteobacteria bacterium]